MLQPLILRTYTLITIAACSLTVCVGKNRKETSSAPVCIEEGMHSLSWIEQRHPPTHTELHLRGVIILCCRQHGRHGRPAVSD